MGGIYAREDGLPEEVWKAIYFHYLPVGVDADAPPSKTQLGKATMTWAAVSLADKLDTIVGLFATGKKPTGSRDPYALRRTAQSVVKILVDLRATSGVESAVDPKALVDRAFAGYEGALRPESGAWHSSLMGFLWERTEHLYEQRGSNPYHARAIWSDDWALYHIIKQRLEDWKRVRDSEQFKALAAMFKRVKNITNDKNDDGRNLNELKAALREPAELALANAMIERWNLLGKAASATDFEQTVQAFADLQPFVDRFFKDVLVMADDARLMLLVRLRRAVIQSIGDISVIASDEKQT
jgi:glycyl-tRNA synthetase beta chain